jgi:DNA-directed RNA polymerase subunit K/omega
MKLKVIIMENSRALYNNEQAVKQIGNIYDVVLIASCRYRELKRGYIPMVKTRLGPVGTTLTEIEQGIVGRDYIVKNVENNRRQRLINFQREQRLANR